MKRVLVLGDSLTLPRDQPEVCLYENTWPILLKNHFDVHTIAIGGGTVRDLYRQLPYHLAYKPDYVILQCGIVDCAPRALTVLELEFFQSLWLTRRFVLPSVRKYSKSLRRWRKVNYTSPPDFEHYLHSIKKTFGSTPVFSVGILPSCEAYEAIVPGISERVAEYNKLLSNTFQESFINTSNIDRNGIMSDFIHLNSIGHFYIYSLIKEKIGGR